MTASQSPRGRASELLSKHGLVATELASTLLTCTTGERIERIQEYAARFDVSVGTVQAALGYLQSTGAVELEARGRLGTYVRRLNYPSLWSLTLRRPIIGALPVPYSRRFEGLETGVRRQFERQALELDLRFTRGSAQRLQALASLACDWVLVSRFAAETAQAHGFDIDTLMLLGPTTYMTQHVLLLRHGIGQLEPGMRVGVDFLSADHVYSVRTVTRGQRVELVDIEYSQGLSLLVAGAIDATVWSREDIPADLKIVTVRPLDLDTDPTFERLGEAAVVVNRGNISMANVLGATLDPAELRAVQHDVLSRARRPGA